MISRERIRYLLIHNKTIRSNIHKAKQITIDMESDADVIEGLTMQAADYSGDRVQTTHEPEVLSMTKVRRERSEQRADESMRWFAIRTQEEEIEHLDLAVFGLEPVLQETIIDRFYDQLTIKQICEKRYSSRRNVTRRTNKAIDIITDTFNRHGAKSLADVHNDVGGKVGAPCHIDQCYS